MKVFLMFADKDFDVKKPLPANAHALVQDLELDTLFKAMARDDKFLLDVVKRAVLLNLTDVTSINYRQHVLSDCLERANVVRELYDVAVNAIQGEKQMWGSIRSPDSILSRSLRLLEEYVGALNQLRRISARSGGLFRSEGFTRFFSMITEEVDDAYLATVQDHLKRLRFETGVLISAGLGKGLKGSNYVLRKAPEEKHAWIQRLLGDRGSSYSFEIDDRDEAGATALRELRERGINGVADAAAQSVDHILSFFVALRTELAFYIGCMNLQEQLASQSEPVCMPVPLPADTLELNATNLCDVCLALKMGRKVVSNDLRANGKSLIVITGANQGGKSTFLRSIGLAQVMTQCGMFVAAERFRASICAGVFTHYKREEDATMKSGKFDEELKRMSEIADQIKPLCILLLNESFSSTNEREGSEIARQVIRALLEANIRVFLVTHMYDLAEWFSDQKTNNNTLFLRAERQEDGQRTFKIVEGEPLPTSYGADLYKQVFA